MTEAKLVTLQTYMQKFKVGMMCIQETHTCKSSYFVSDEGFLVILSGASGDVHDSAGVGFIVAPWLRRSVVGFCQASSRMASLKLRVQGGKAAFISAYAPHSGKRFDERQQFFQEVSDFLSQTSCHGPKFLMGDLNARL